MKIPEDEKRIMKVFNVKDYDKIPKRTNKAVNIYFNFLNKRLAFPIYGAFEKETGPLSSDTISIKLHKLSDIYDEFYGVFVEGRKGRKKAVIPLVEFNPENEDDENFQLIDDYKTWFWNW